MASPKLVWRIRGYPKDLENMLRSLSREAATLFARPDWTPTDDILAMEHSVRGQGEIANYRKPVPKLTGNETPAEYAKWQRQVLEQP